jgi:preprotein translocase subunit SecD
MKRAVLWMICTLLLSCGRTPQQSASVSVVFRLAESERAEGLEAAVFKPTGETFYLHEEVLLSEEDIASATPSGEGEIFMVSLILTEDGREKLARFTEAYVGQRVGILVDEQLVSVPRINEPIREGRAIIDGLFTQREAERIAKGIERKWLLAPGDSRT